MGADIMNCMPLVPVKGAAFEELPEPDNLTTSRVRLQSGLHLPQMSHCARCRADAVGYVGENVTAEQVATLRHFANASLNPAEDAARPYVAVATLEGTLVNQHLGEADRLAIFEAKSAGRPMKAAGKPVGPRWRIRSKTAAPFSSMPPARLHKRRLPATA
jgi:nitrogen fixation protein NifB